KDRRSAEMGSVRGAQLHDAVQCGRVPGDLGLLRLWRRRPAGRDPAGRQAVPGTPPVPCCRRVREGDPVPRPPSGDGRGLRSAMQCAGKIVLVTGAQQGIGRAMAVEFAAAGADVAINWLDNQAAADRVGDEVRAHGRRAALVQADISQLGQTRAMISAVEQELGSVDVLINNAGVFPRVPFLEMTEGDWDYVLDVNLKGACF